MATLNRRGYVSTNLFSRGETGDITNCLSRNIHALFNAELNFAGKIKRKFADISSFLPSQPPRSTLFIPVPHNDLHSKSLLKKKTHLGPLNISDC